MKHKLLMTLSVVALNAAMLNSQIEFKFDSTVYKTMYAADLCAFLKANPKTMLIDVRTPGEFSDTSSHLSLNIGHLKNAINISIDSIPKHIEQLRETSAEPIILYCSHSQRSRRVSKTLMESGFTKVWNLNGGMTLINQLSSVEFPCKKEMIVSMLPYKNIPADEAMGLIKSAKDLIVLDVRPAAQFEGKDTLEHLNIGRLKNAINIPAAEVNNKLSQLDKNKAILVYDASGSESNGVANYLAANGCARVHHLLGGLSAIIGREAGTAKLRKEMLDGTPAYTILNTSEAVHLITQQKDLVILDVRPVEEFSNQAKMYWRNLGHIKNAINLPPAGYKSKLGDLAKYKTAAVLVYGTRDAAACCKALKQMGFENVNLAYNGMWDFVSGSFNIKSLKEIKPFLVDHDGLY